MANIDWSQIHHQDKSWRQQIQGDAVADYVLERYLRLFERAFEGSPPLSFLELGSGNGDLSKRILEKKYPFVGKYVISECFQEGVDWLNKCGLDALLLNAEQIDLEDSSFDVVISFDVMHHVDDPYKMAREMMRVSRGRVLLTEANGLSVGRKLMELTPRHRRAGEQSYLPSTYVKFFSTVENTTLTRKTVYPFLFVFKTPPALAGSIILLSKMMEKIPLVSWQCATVCLDLEFKKTDKNG